MADIKEGGAQAPVDAQPAQLTEQQQIEADAVLRFKKSQPGYVDENPIPEGFNSDGTPIQADDHIPEKYKGKSIEDIIAMHQEAEKKIGTPDPVTPPADPDPAPTPKGEETPQPKADDVTGFAKYTTEYAESGAVSEESYKELEARGFPRSDVDAYIEGQKAIGASFTAKVYEITGGEEGYTQLIQWAETGMDTATVTEFNEAIAIGDQAKVTRLVEFMALKHGSLNKTPNRIAGDSGADGGGLKPFAHKDEWQRATNPRNTSYGKDAKYTKMVDDRFLLSKRKGTL